MTTKKNLTSSSLSAINQRAMSRRTFIKSAAGAGGAIAVASLLPDILRSRRAPAVIAQETAKPMQPYGVASGDILPDQAVIWGKTDRPARMILAWSTTDSFKNTQTIVGPAALDFGDYTAKYNLSNLPAGQDILAWLKLEPGVEKVC